jgi:hypothetical protein
VAIIRVAGGLACGQLSVVLLKLYTTVPTLKLRLTENY